MLHLYNTLSRTKEAFIPNVENQVSLYSCGPTVYNNPHVGNLRAVLCSDTLQRWFRFGEKFEVKWVMNITDVDDKTIRDSKNLYPKMNPKEALKKFTTHYASVFFDDIAEAGVVKSHFLSTPYATDYIEEMKDLIQKIVNNGYGYVVGGSVYLDVKKYRQKNEYGKLVSLDFDSMQSTERVDNDEYEKDSVSDFVLWKGLKDGEPFWDFNVTVSSNDNDMNVSANADNVDKNTETLSLPGRPGWHIECSAMSKSLFPNFPFDIHTGGVDLCFPHHEDEICQAKAGYGTDTANYWVHNEHLMVEGRKMSKSLGNFYVLKDLQEKGFTAEEIRFFLVTSHYRTKVNLSDESLKSSSKMLKRIKGFVNTIERNSVSDISIKDVEEGNVVFDYSTLEKTFCTDFYTAMRDDLNVSVSITLFFQFAQDLSKKSLDAESFKGFVEVVELVANTFGISFVPSEKELPQDILDLMSLRDMARSQKDWTKSDEIREILQKKGFEVRDENGKTVVL